MYRVVDQRRVVPVGDTVAAKVTPVYVPQYLRDGVWTFITSNGKPFQFPSAKGCNRFLKVICDDQ